MTIAEFYTLYPIAENKEDVDKQLLSLPKPDSLAGRPLPTDLNGISIGEVMMLQQALKNGKTDFERFKSCASILLQADIRPKHSAEAFFGFGLWLLNELERIGKLFDRVKIQPTDDEIQAGYNTLQFGFFGTLDWWCRRMGIKDHSEAERVPWIRIYKCMDMDGKRLMYERKLRQIYQNKQQKRRR